MPLSIDSLLAKRIEYIVMLYNEYTFDLKNHTFASTFELQIRHTDWEDDADDADNMGNISQS